MNNRITILCILGSIGKYYSFIELLDNYKWITIDKNDSKTISYYVGDYKNMFWDLEWVTTFFTNGQSYVGITKSIDIEENDNIEDKCEELYRNLVKQINIIRLLTGESLYIHSAYFKIEDKTINFKYYPAYNSPTIAIDLNHFAVDNVNKNLTRLYKLSDCKLLDLATKYFNLSFSEKEMENQIVFLATGLEIMFNPSETGELSHRIARNCAVFLGKSVAESQYLYKKIKQYYSYRSQIVHTGTIENKKFNTSFPHTIVFNMQTILRYIQF